jgi:hypothetical protein
MKRTIRRTMPAPRTILGFRQDGRPIYPILGASEDDPSNDDGQGPDDLADPDGADALGDAGKKALDAMKQRAKDERTARLEAEKSAQAQAEKIATMQAQIEALSAKKGDEVDVEALIESKVAEVRAQALQQVARASIKAAATGVVVDPDLVASLPEFDPTNFVTESGDVDEAKIATALSDLVSSKPYLAAQGQERKGSGDGGTRKGSEPSQLTESDLERMSPAEIRKAQDEGRLNRLLTGS